MEFGCSRTTLPVSLCGHVTFHAVQGQTWATDMYVVCADFGKQPQALTGRDYVAVSRTTSLANFVPCGRDGEGPSYKRFMQGAWDKTLQRELAERKALEQQH